MANIANPIQAETMYILSAIAFVFFGWSSWIVTFKLSKEVV